MAIKLIVAVDENNGIGYKNELLFRIKKDLQRFVELTTGHFVVMGRKTYESLPKALPNRTNVIVTRDKNYNPKNPVVIVQHDIKQIISHYLDTGKQDKDLWVIGGSEIYKQFLPYADEVHVTLVHKKAEDVDTYFPTDEMKEQGMKGELLDAFYSDDFECDVSFLVYKRA